MRRLVAVSPGQFRSGNCPDTCKPIPKSFTFRRHGVLRSGQVLCVTDPRKQVHRKGRPAHFYPSAKNYTGTTSSSRDHPIYKLSGLFCRPEMKWAIRYRGGKKPLKPIIYLRPPRIHYRCVPVARNRSRPWHF